MHVSDEKLHVSDEKSAHERRNADAADAADQCSNLKRGLVKFRYWADWLKSVALELKSKERPLNNYKIENQTTFQIIRRGLGFTSQIPIHENGHRRRHPND